MGMQMVKKGLCLAPLGYWKMGKSEQKKVCNGAGPKGWGWLVPDTLWGLSVTDAANIHDFMYHWAIWPKVMADKVFYQNMLSIVNDKGGVLKYPRRARAYTYYLAVRVGGKNSYGGKR